MSKNKLVVLANWATPLEKTWSGTTYSLTKALSQFYDVEIKNLAVGRLLRILDRLSQVQLFGRVFGSLYDTILKVKANYILRKCKGIPVLEICEDVKVRNPYFTYQDMTYQAGIYVNDLRKKYPFVYSAAGSSKLEKAEIIRRIERQIDEYNNSSASFFMSKWVWKIMCDSYPQLSHKFYHIGGGTNIDVTRVNNKLKYGNKFLFVGRDFERKAGDVVINAFKIVQSKYLPNAELHIAGPSKQPFPPSKNIFYYGDVDVHQISDLMNKCDVFCMPSRFEAYGLVFIESLIYGMPCVARDMFEMPYFIKHGLEGRLIIEDDIDCYAKAMYETIIDKNMINYVQQNMLKYVEEYSWSSVALRVKNIMDKILVK